MKKIFGAAVVMLSVVAFGVGCGTDESEAKKIKGTSTLELRSPTDGTTVHFLPGVYDSMAYDFVVNEFGMSENCKGHEACGHVHAYLDEGACGESIAYFSPGVIDRTCDLGVTRAFKVELHDQLHRVVQNELGVVARTTASIATKEATVPERNTLPRPAAVPVEQ